VHCISLVRFSILVNDTLTGFFSSSRGLKQSDRRMISAMVNRGLLSGFSVGSKNVGALNIFHLLFADDTLIFCWDDFDRLRNFRYLFLCFEAVSGLKTNLAKLELALVGNVNNVEGLAITLGCIVSSLPMKY
jgi:hypothetical protein